MKLERSGGPWMWCSVRLHVPCFLFAFLRFEEMDLSSKHSMFLLEFDENV
ncbi:hypothetical protein EJB05_49510, partial [Eragrostis curvula]